MLGADHTRRERACAVCGGNGAPTSTATASPGLVPDVHT